MRRKSKAVHESVHEYTNQAAEIVETLNTLKANQCFSDSRPNTNKASHSSNLWEAHAALNGLATTRRHRRLQPDQERRLRPAFHAAIADHHVYGYCLAYRYRPHVEHLPR
jgi:hypothetical protein